ncbi:MAG: bifunctional (p)ppGpp synthetase/guanosine-3',5'-bis(diphosphate) 3'-pyrophosphohydrolase [Gammaproteobacteria bacterium]|nr:bifunctional (p)ppGpp synthetase/guanosine-3',5'-bis(diphosphate) 3'-pyrophosphohydrolase [Gammaproteobacteria bacterium]
MKRIAATQWQDSFNEQESNTIQAALSFSRGGLTPGELSKKDSAERENIANVLDHINVDYQTIAAAILLVGLQNQAFEAGDLSSVFEAPIIRLAEEARSLIYEEGLWLDKLEDDFSEEDVSSHHMMLLGIMKDARAIFILLAKQLIRMHDLPGQPEKMQRHIAKESRYIFAPLANRLGIGQLKWELEDLAFRYLQPEEYKSIANSLEERRVDREQYMAAFVAQLQAVLDDANVKAEVYGRPKHIYSIWRKMQNKDLQFSDLYDVRAMRVMVDDLAACYTVLSIVHSLWEFIPREYDDYIAAPKNNNYQSLHTAVIGPGGKVVEIQIRTQEMHAHAELGVAAHWRYKEGGKHDENLEQHIESLRRALSDDANGNNGGDKTLTKQSRIYVLSPKGNVVELPAGSTPLDFAYHIHTDVGHKCRGAKVNGKMVTLTTPLKSGQTVEIITAKNATPSRDWLVSHMGYLKSPRSRAKVKQWFKREFRDEHIADGKAAIAKQVSILPSNTALQKLAETFNLGHVDDVFAAVGRGDLGVQQVLNTLKEPEENLSPAPLIIPRDHGQSATRKRSADIVVEGIDELMTSLARCCKPMAGDEVIGFITKGRGVTIHRNDCQNIEEMKRRYPERFIPVKWGESEGQRYEVDIEIHAMDRSGLLRDITSLLAGESVDVCAANTYTDKKLQQARMRLTIELDSSEKLPRVIAKLLNLRGVFEAVRVK